MINLKSNCKYSLVVPTSMGVRITPKDRQPVHTSSTFEMQGTSAETNVASIPASLGLPTHVLTKFVAGSPIARFIQADLRARGMTYEGPEVDQGDAWGFRHQFNIADSGFGGRGPRVHNDRAGEVGRTLTIADFDASRLFGKDGVQILHVSGLIAALSEQTSEFCTELARIAHDHGTLVSFDLNYRASFWKGREDELSKAFADIAGHADILVGNEEDFQLALGIEGPEAGGASLADKIDSFKEMISRVKKRYSQAEIFGTTLREVANANSHLWGAIIRSGDDWHVAEPREIGVLDRIGGGDGFVGGLLYGLLKGWDAERAMQFGWATGAMAATMLTDYALPADEDQVWSMWKGNARVKR
ncbi:MAG: PfkB family carbohydrate kinase [Spirochaetales bacterium]